MESLSGSPPDETLLGVAAAQRLLQALGAYGKLWLTDGLPWYKQFILPALTNLEAAARSAGFDRLAAMADEVRGRLDDRGVQLPAAWLGTRQPDV